MAIRRHTQVGLTQLEFARPVELHAIIHEEAGSYWAEVKELPGCFASGTTLDELKDALVEAIGMHLEDENGTPTAQIEEMRVLVTA